MPDDLFGGESPLQIFGMQLISGLSALSFGRGWWLGFFHYSFLFFHFFYWPSWEEVMYNKPFPRSGPLICLTFYLSFFFLKVSKREVMEKDEKSNSTYNFIRTILLSLCANFNEQFVPKGNWTCQFKSEYFYSLRALRGKSFKFTTLQKLPLSGSIIDENGVLRGIGIAFDLVHQIQEKVGFYYNLTLPKENVVGDEKGGIIEMLKNKEVDMAVAFIPMTQLFRDLVSFSSALAEFEWVLFMARPSASASGSGLLAPFQETVWVFILISLIVAGPAMYFITYMRMKFSKVDSTSKAYSLSTCFWFVYGALMKQGSTLNPAYDSSRLFFATWWIFITILTSFYTANLTAFLTLSQFTLTIQSTRDIYVHHRHWMADKGGYEETLISSDNAFDFLKETIPKYGQFVSDSLEQRLQRVLKGEIYVTEKRQAELIMMKDYLNKTRNQVEENKRCTFVLTPKSVLAKPVGFAYQKNSELTKLFDPMLTYLMSGGIITHLLNEGLPITSICPLNLANRERKLLNSDLATTYKTVSIGFGSALTAFVGEVIIRFIKKRTFRKKTKFYPEALQKIKPSLNNLFLINEYKSGLNLNSNLLTSQYFKEITPFKYSNNYILNQENQSGRTSPTKNILFQYTH